MKLHEAMRLGAMMKPQARERYQHGNATCAVGAAFDAIGRLARLEKEPVEAIKESFPIISGTQDTTCPSCGDMRHSRFGIVIHLNDDHGWTREQIADWVQTIEEAQEPVSTVQIKVECEASPSITRESAAQK